MKFMTDSGITGMFMDRRTAAKHGFRLQKLERPIMVRNVNGTNNSGGAITHQVEANMHYKGYIERIDLLEKIRGSKARDNEVIKAVEEIKKAGVKMLRDKEWREENKLILRDRKVYVLKDEKLRAKVIWLHHDTLVGEHKGQ